MSNYEFDDTDETVDVAEFWPDLDLEDDDWEVPAPEEEDSQVEIRCHRCYGTGLVEVHGQETDCIDCEGIGSVLVPL